MEANTDKNKKPLLTRIAERLLKDQEELDAMAVQFALGKAEAKEQFEATKIKMKQSVHEFRIAILEQYQQRNEIRTVLKQKLDELEVQLSAVSTESKEVFEKQRQNILKAIEDVKSEIANDPNVQKAASFFNSSVEKAYLQFELFEKNWDQSKTAMMENFKDEMKTAKFRIEDIMQKAKDRREVMGEKLEDFNDEIKEAYSHIRKAFKSL